MTHSYPSPSASVVTAISSRDELLLALEWAAGGDTIALAPGMSIAEAQELARQAEKKIAFTQEQE